MGIYGYDGEHDKHHMSPGDGTQLAIQYDSNECKERNVAPISQ